MVGTATPQGTITRRIGAIFRDQNELPAGSDLSHSLTTALLASEWLIVVCSPAARQSRWVDLEIECFKQSRDSAKILCFIVDGEPFAGNVPGREELECFPAALGFLECDVAGSTVAEPIAADSRSVGVGRQLAKLKIISGLLGVGLNALIRRDSQRRHRNLLLLTGAALVGMLSFALLSLVAVEARRSEELRRAEAEDLIEFMLSDLRERLEAVGRLDVLDAVGKKAIQYYSSEDISDFSESSLGRRARAFHLLGEVDDLRGSMESAKAAFDQAFTSTEELLQRRPNDPERIFNHAQSVFWRGYLDWRLGENAAAEAAFMEYTRLSKRLVGQDPVNPVWQTELGSAYANLGVYVLETNSSAAAVPYFELAQTTKTLALSLDPENDTLKLELATVHAWLADAYRDTGDLAAALAQRRTELGIYAQVLLEDPGNQDVNQRLQNSQIALARLAFLKGDLALAEQHFIRAQGYGNDLLSLDPENTFTISQSAALHADFARLRILEGRLGPGSALLERSDELISSLLNRDSGILEWKMRLHSNRVLRGLILALKDEWEQAYSILQQSADELVGMVEQNQDVREIEYILAECYLDLAFVQRSRAEEAAAVRYAGLAVQKLQPLQPDLPPMQMDLLAQAYGILGEQEKERILDIRLQALDYQRKIFWK